MDSDVEMVELPPHESSPAPSSSSHSHVSPPQSPTRSVLDDLDVYGSPSKSVLGDADDDSAANDVDDAADVPPPTNDDEQPEPDVEGDPEGSHEHESDPSDTENSSDASEDDVDKDLVREDVIPEPNPGIKAEEQEPVAAIRIPLLVDLAPVPNPEPQQPPPPTSPLSAPPTSPSKPTQKKPKSHHVPPVPPPPVLPPPMQTIRLQIQLGGPENYQVDVRKQAHDEGIEWGILMVEKKYNDASSDGESEPENEKEKDADGDVNMDDGKPKSKKKKKKKTKAVPEYYDVNDPFIDDSELAIDERTYIAQTKQTGFYVSSGEVALVRDKAPKKAAAATTKGKKKAGPTLSLNFPIASSSKPASTAKKPTKSAPASSAAPARLSGLGTKDSPIPLEDEDDAAPNGANPAKGKWRASSSMNGDENESEVGKKRKRSLNGNASGEGPKKRKPVDVENFHPELQASIAKLKVAIAAESWETKSKFPPSLKPMLNDLAVQAIQLDEYNDQFFNLMPTIFPYNKFTMTKLIKRTVFKDHTDLLNTKQKELLAELERLATEGFSRAQEEWEKNVANYEEKQREKAAIAKAGSENPDGGSSHGTEDQDATKEDNANPGTGKPATAQGPPAKRYRMSDEMKGIVWQLVLLSNELCRLENEKNGLEGSVLQVSEQGQRKSLYQRIVSAFPPGWMASGQISRDVSAMKKKFEKEAEE